MSTLRYSEYCAKDGALQETARAIDSLGFNASSDNPLLPNAGILRGAEAVDAFLNAAQSGHTTSARESGGRILCSIVQLGGVIYVAIVVLVALVLLSLLPCFNFVFSLLFDLAAAEVQEQTTRSKLARIVKKQKRMRPTTTASGNSDGASLPSPSVGASLAGVGGAHKGVSNDASRWKCTAFEGDLDHEAAMRTQQPLRVGELVGVNTEGSVRAGLEHGFGAPPRGGGESAIPPTTTAHSPTISSSSWKRVRRTIRVAARLGVPEKSPLLSPDQTAASDGDSGSECSETPFEKLKKQIGRARLESGARPSQ